MNSALKPVLTSSGPQNPPVTSQLNKPMHPQTTPSTYGQPSTHMPQSLVNLPHNNPNAAHNHPNPAHQTNHYSLNVPNAPQHYSTNSPSTIPASNHPVPNVSQAAAGGQTYAAPKNVPYSGGYQPNLGHPPNQNPLPPVSQSLPATQSQPPQHTPAPAEAPTEKPQSNGTPEVKSPTKPEPQENHISLPKDKISVPPIIPQTTEKPEEKNASPTVPEQKQKPEAVKVGEETQASLPPAESVAPQGSTPNTATNTSGESSPAESASGSTTASETKAEAEADGSKDAPKELVAESVETATNVETAQTTPKSKDKDQKTTPTAKSATTPRTPTRKSKTPKPEGDSPKSSKTDSKAPSTQKSPSVMGKSKRTRIRTQPYQSPLPEIEIITKISSSTPKSKNNDDKLIVFYKNEFLAVRNSEGSFYICQAVQNIYKSSPKIRIRWLSQDKNEKSGEVYTPDFYDNTDFDCILTNLNLERVDKGRYRLPPAEKERTDSILKRSLAVEKGEVTSPSLTEEHPDGIDLSLYKEESQLKKRKATKRKASSSMKSGKKSDNTTKSPDQPKARKVATKSPKKSPAKRSAAASKKPTTTETKKGTASSRTDRAKRRSDNQNHNKVSPVVDQKKARVLAKVARKTAVTSGSASNKTQPVTKNTKVPKATPSSSKVQRTPPRAATRKTKRSSRK